MKKISKRILCFILAVAIILSSIIFYNINLTRNDFVDNLAQIYSEYDSNLTEKQKLEPFGYNRLIVNDYNGKDYNATKIAYDKKNNFAVLQYDTKQDAIDAYNDMITEGVCVDVDSVMELAEAPTEYAKCQMSPDNSALAEFPQYLNNYNMAYNDVVVGVIDSGVMLDHSYLKNRFISRGIDLSSDNNQDADYGDFVDNLASTHATMVSGIIANNTPDNVKILPIKVIKTGEKTTSASCVISAINAAVDMNVNVINISIAGPGSAASFQRAITNAYNKGICVCVASGNESMNVETLYPASIPEAITVGAVNSMKEYQSFSNYGTQLDFVAPGVSITSCSPAPDGTSSYKTASGTSFAAPYATAAFANLKSLNTKLSVNDAYNMIMSNVEDLGDRGRDDYYGNGLIRLGNLTMGDDSYRLSIPQGALDIYKTKNYVEDTQPWRLFNDAIKYVTVSASLNEIGDYNFYNMSSASFSLPQKLVNIGKYAFYGCKSLKQMFFDLDIINIGVGAFGNNNPDFVITGYNNTPAQLYANAENVKFKSIGCNHNYLVDVVEPSANEEGYVIYTCSACGESYKEPYIAPKILDTGACGDNLTYTMLDIGKLKIEGTGAMYDYTNTKCPWADYANDIKIVEIKSGVTSVNPFAFYGCNNLVKINNNSPSYVYKDNCLYNADLSQLVLYCGGSNNLTIELPSTVTKIDASALICANKVNNIKCNNNFVFKDGVLYDTNGNIILFMPHCAINEFVINKPITIKENAMILCDSVDKVLVDDPNVVFETNCIGYKYNAPLVKRDILISYCYNANNAMEYANTNGFRFVALNKGRCGENARWEYDETTNTLNISGSGKIDEYNAPDQIPWVKFMPNIKTLIIGDEITNLPRYAFYNANSINTISMPLSVKAPVDETTWYGCNSVRNMSLTYGNGYTDDYGASYNDIIYTYTPWYMNRSNITKFSLDPNVKYIGRFMFRNLLALRNLTLKSCENLAEYALINCPNLAEITIESKNTIIDDYSIFSYYSGNFSIYKNRKLHGYYKSTSQAYCDKFGVEFIPIGCNHYLKGTVRSLNNIRISDAQFFVDDELKAISNVNGQFIAAMVDCGEHTYKLVYNGVLLSQGIINVEHTNYNADIKIAIGDYVNDGVINTKDYAKANKVGLSTDNIDLGNSFSTVTLNFRPYDVQKTPAESSLFIERQPNSVDCRIYIEKDFDTEFTITECGILYGANLPLDFLTLDNIGKSVGSSGKVKMRTFTAESGITFLPYSLTSGQGTIVARIFVKYSNGVDEFLYYSDCVTYTY